MIIRHHQIKIPVGRIHVGGSLSLIREADSIVVFSHGTGSSRFSPRNRYVANLLHKAGFSTLLFDLLTEEEGLDYSRRFDIPLMTQRLLSVREWVERQPEFATLPMGYFGSSTGAAAALHAVAASAGNVRAVVSRGGRPDLAMDALPEVKVPTLFLVGSLDTDLVNLTARAYSALTCEKQLHIIDGASHLFEEPGRLHEVASQAVDWFSRYLKPVLA